jgi:hypothetical protein
MSAEYGYVVLYTTPAQNHLSFAGYFHDVVASHGYRQRATFLPDINAPKSSALPKLQHATFAIGAIDQIINPPMSGAWRYCEEQQKFEAECQLDPPASFWNTTDPLGLGQLQRSNRLNIVVEPSASHHEWLVSADLFERIIAPAVASTVPPLKGLNSACKKIIK